MGSPQRIQAVARRIANQYRDGFRQIAVVVSAMSGETNRIVDLVSQTNPNASPFSWDLAVSAGEQVSVALLTAALEAEGIPVVPYLAYQLGILTDEHHSRARVLSIDCTGIEENWRDGIVSVVAGFQGVTKNRKITTLGRGGSDTSAVALACAINASFCEINTDVDGVYTADPRMVPGAKLIAKLDYEVALEMAAMGSKVLHPRCVELGAKYNIPLVVRNSFKEDASERTVVMKLEGEMIESPAVNGVTLEKQVARVIITALPGQKPLISDVFNAVAKAGVNVDMISFEETGNAKDRVIGFTVTEGEQKITEKALASLKGAYPSLSYFIESGFAKITAVGVGMHSHSGVAASFFSTLSEHNIPIFMISTSEIKISAVVKKEDSEKSVMSLHEVFQLAV